MTDWRPPTKLADCHNILDLRALARRRLPGPIFHYLDGGAETEVTARGNISAFDDEKLVPKYLVDVGTVKTATRVLGQPVAWPMVTAPAGAARFYHPEGELAVARAAAKAGALYGLSVMSTRSLEDVARAASGPKMFQVLAFKDRGLTRELIERCRNAGYQALCLTVDAGVRGNRERELRTGLGIPVKLSLSSMLSFASRPGWFLGLARSGPLSIENLVARAGSRELSGQSRYIGEQLDASVTWQDVQEIAGLWKGPFAIKGLMSAGDARRAVDAGASAVIVSNHGGRQLDGAAAPVEVLPQMAKAVGGKIELILDGGIRRGVHILKALALGATACSVGRPYLYGLAAGGEEGAKKALDILRVELIRAMQLSGCTDVTRVDPDLIRRF